MWMVLSGHVFLILIGEFRVVFAVLQFVWTVKYLGIEFLVYPELID